MRCSAVTMAKTDDEGRDGRVLLLTPTGRDADLTGRYLKGAGISVEVCAGMEELCEKCREGAGAALIAEEALTAENRRRLLDALGVQKLKLAVGGSMGGMQVLQWAAAYPERVFAAVPIACAARHSAQNIAFHEVGRQAIMADPDWAGGAYWKTGKRPERGLAVARMAAHITYLSETALHRKFGRNLQDRNRVTYGFDADFQVESYLRHQGISFVERFDANSYLYITRAMDYFDLAADHGGVLANAFRGTKTRFCAISFTSDWLFPTAESREIVHALNAVAANVSFVEIESDKGHDAFLLDEPEFFATLRGFLNGCAEHRGLNHAR
jgi:homoserine O-acetyltransferase